MSPGGNLASEWARGPLSSVLAAVLRKQAGVAVALQGEAGIGKTYALRLALSTAPCRHLTLHATAPLAGAVPSPRPKALSLLAETLLDQISQGKSVEPSAAAGAFVDVMRSLAPFVLAFEDAHEADEARLGFLVEVGRLARAGRGTAVVLTTRHEPPPGFRGIRIASKGLDEVQAILEEEIGARVPETAVDWIQERAAGNPLFALEYFRHLARQGHVWSDGRSWHWRTPAVDSMPTSVEALLEDPIRRAREAPGLATVLEARAALEREVDTGVVARVAGVDGDALRSAERALELRGLLRDGDFAHPLFREVTRATTPARRRRELAQRAIRAFAATPVRAARYVPDADLSAEEALGILAAAAAAVRDRDETQAGRWLAAAVPYAPSERGSRLAVEAAQLLQLTDQAEARRLLNVALATVPDDRDALLLLAELEALEGRQEAADALLARLPGDPRSDGDWIERQSKLRFAIGDHQAVVDDWSALPDGMVPSPGLVYRAGFSLVLLDRLADADAIARGALERPSLSTIDRARLHTVLGLAASYGGDRAGARLSFDEAVAMARASGQKAYLAATLHNRASLLEETNDVPGMLSDAREALRLYAETGSTRHYASTLTKVARILHELGRYDEAESRLLESRAIHQQARPSAFAVTCEAHLCGLYLDWRSPHAQVLAHKHALAAMSVAEHVQDHAKKPLAMTYLALVETRLGRPGRAVAVLDELATLQPDRERTTYQVIEARALALEGLGDLAAAEELLERAVALAFVSDWHVYAHKIGLELDRLRGDAAQATARVAWFEEHGLLNGVKIAETYFPGLAAGMAPGGDREAGARGAGGGDRPPSRRRGGPEAVPTRQAPAAARVQGPGRVPTAPAAAAPAVRVEVLGPLRVLRDGREVPVRGHLRRQLLALLLEQRLAGAEGLSAPDLIDALYPGRDDAGAAAALKQLVFQTRKALGARTLLATRSGYALGEVTSDAEDFLASLDPRWWRGPYREDLDEGNAVVAGALVHGLRSAAWARVGPAPEEAKRIGLLMLRADPYDPRNLHLALAALDAAGRGEEATAVYASARARFAELGEDLPSSWRDWWAARAPATPGEPPGAAASARITGA